MKKTLTTTIIALAFIIVGCKKDNDFPKADQVADFPGMEWVQVNDPSQYGWSLEKLQSVERFSKASGTKSVMIVENGRLIYAWGDCSEKYYVASVRKSLLSMIYGYYVPSVISLDATMGEYGINDIEPELNDDEKQATVRHLLSSSSGVFHPAAAADGGTLPERNSMTHGEAFYYNNWGFNVLGTIFEKRTGKSLFKVFHDSIAARIGLQDFNWQTDGRYDYINKSIHPAYHFDMTTRDLARIGLLMQNQGVWEGKQILPTAWIDSISTHKIAVSSDYGGGSYGYMWWVNDGGYMTDFANVPNDAFSAQGHWSQLVMVIPSRNLVIVHRAKKNLDSSLPLMIVRMILNAKET